MLSLPSPSCVGDDNRKDDDMKTVSVVAAAIPHSTDFADGIKREWYWVGRKSFAVTEDGELLDGEGFPMSGIDASAYVVGFVHDNDAFRVAEAIRKTRAAYAAINRDMDEHFPALDLAMRAAINRPYALHHRHTRRQPFRWRLQWRTT
jgi:hypothetical protein